MTQQTSRAGVQLSTACRETAPITTIHRIEADGVGVFYRAAGEPKAPLVLLLPGFPTSSFVIMSIQSPSSSIGTTTGGRAVGKWRGYEGKNRCSRACVDDVVGTACSARRQDSVEGWGPRRLVLGICRRRASCGRSLCGRSEPAAHSLVCFCPCSLGRETARYHVCTARYRLLHRRQA